MEAFTLIIHEKKNEKVILISLSSKATVTTVPCIKFKTTSDFPHSWNIIVFSTRSEHVEKWFGSLHDPLVLSSRFINQLTTYACLWRLCVDFSCQD